MNKPDIKDRIVQLMQHKRITAAIFADTIGVQRSSISHILAGRNKPSLDLLEKIVLKYPEFSTEWLITGLGSMLKQPNAPLPTINNAPNEPVKQAPQLNIGFTNVTIPDPEVIPPNFSTQNTIKSEPTILNEPKSPITDPPIDYFTKNDVERVIIFYKNGSFKQYLPAKSE